MNAKINAYAKLLLTTCLNLDKDSKLFIIGTTFNQEFIEVVINVASTLGIKKIETLITNPELQKEYYLTKTYEEIIASPLFSKEKYNQMAKEGYAFLNIYSPLPGFFDEVNPELLAQVNNYQISSIKEYRTYQESCLIKWNICSCPNPYWVKSITGLNTIEELWAQIFDICLLNEADPNMAWTKKIALLNDRATYLNDLHLTKLTFENNLGTNLSVGLSKDYLFCSASSQNLVNMPTEEVFTSPSRLLVNGKVFSSKPLIYNNHVIDEFYLEFKEGKVTSYKAKVGEEILKHLLNTDEGSSYLGEVALVDHNSKISQTNLIFNNTLYDENASCHLALGASFKECLRDGLNLNPDQLIKKGLNQSKEHVDFFIGTSDLTVNGYLSNGHKVVIMEKGNFIYKGVN